MNSCDKARYRIGNKQRLVREAWRSSINIYGRQDARRMAAHVAYVTGTTRSYAMEVYQQCHLQQY